MAGIILFVLEVKDLPDMGPSKIPEVLSVTKGQAVDVRASFDKLLEGSSSVNLSVSGLPAEAVATFDKATIIKGEAATLKIDTSKIKAGTYPVQIIGTEEK